jgi:Fe-S oxidoreductase
MAARTVARFNEAAQNEGRSTVVTWCPSCHLHMSDIMAPGNAVGFEITHITELLAERADRLAPLLQTSVKKRILLHRHVGFATHVPVNDRVFGLLSRIPELELVEGPAHPGHMCSALAAVPGALTNAVNDTWTAAIDAHCDTVCTIFHSCHRELSALDGTDDVHVRNWVQLIAEAMGIKASDAYLEWRRGGAPDIAAIERADEARYRSLVEPELRKPSPLSASKGAGLVE